MDLARFEPKAYYIGSQNSVRLSTLRFPSKRDNLKTLLRVLRTDTVAKLRGRRRVKQWSRDDSRVGSAGRNVGDRRPLLAPLRSRCRLYRSAASLSPHSGTPRAVPPGPVARRHGRRSRALSPPHRGHRHRRHGKQPSSLYRTFEQFNLSPPRRSPFLFFVVFFNFFFFCPVFLS